MTDCCRMKDFGSAAGNVENDQIARSICLRSVRCAEDGCVLWDELGGIPLGSVGRVGTFTWEAGYITLGGDDDGSGGSEAAHPRQA